MDWDAIETKMSCMAVRLASALDADDFEQVNEISEQRNDLIQKLKSDVTLHTNDKVKLFIQALIENTTTQIEKIEERKKSLTRNRFNFVRVKNGYHP